MNEPNSVEPGDGRDRERPRLRRLILGIAIGVAAIVATIVLLIALEDDGSDARNLAAAGEAPAPTAGAARVEPPARKPSPAPIPAQAPPPLGLPPVSPAPVGASPGADAGAGGGREPPSAKRPSAAADTPGRSAHPDAGAAKPTVAPAAGRPDAGAPSGPDGGTSRSADQGARSGGKAGAGGDSGRRGSYRDSRDDDGDYVLVARFVPTGGAVLEGKVLDADGGHPVANTMVEARHAGKYMKTNTDAAGAFRMVGMLPDTRVVVWIGGGRHDPFVSERIDVALPGEGQVGDTGTVRLLRGDEMAPRLDGWVGLFVTRRSGRVTVSAVSPWLPADRAGVVVGDALLSIDGRDLGGFGPRAATFLLRGPTGSTTSVVVESSSKERRKLALERVAR